MKKTGVLLLLVLLCCLFAAGCNADAYSEYASAYNRVSANGGIDANISATVSMNGTTIQSNGNFKVDTIRNILYFNLQVGDETIIQFSDGNYLYTEQNGHKVRYSLKSKPSQDVQTDKQEAKSQDNSAFDATEFLKEFSSFLEAGKIREMGLMNAIAKQAVVKTTKTGNTYSLTIAPALTKLYLNTMASTETNTDDPVQIQDLKDFSYVATVDGQYVTRVDYAGNLTVKVPASLTQTGSAESYQLDLTISVSFNNPGQAVTVEIPSAENFETIQ